MNQTVFVQLKLSLKKNLLMFVCLINELRSNPTLGSIIKRVKLKHNNIFVNNLINMRT